MKRLFLISLLFSTFAHAVPPAPPIDTIPEKHQANMQKLIALYDAAKQKEIVSYSELAVLVKAISRVPGRIIKLYIDLPEIRKFVADQRKAARDRFYSDDLEAREGDESLTPAQRLAACNSIAGSNRTVANFQDRQVYNDQFDDAYQGVVDDKTRNATVKTLKANLKIALKGNETEWKNQLKLCKARYTEAMTKLRAELKAK